MNDTPFWDSIARLITVLIQICPLFSFSCQKSKILLQTLEPLVLREPKQVAANFKNIKERFLKFLSQIIISLCVSQEILFFIHIVKTYKSLFFTALQQFYS